MAYVEKYYTIWIDSEAKEHEIKLLQDGASAGTTALGIQNLTPYKFYYRGTKKSQVEDQVFGREMLFDFIVPSAEIAAIKAIFESDYKEWKIEHYLDLTLDAVYWLQPDNATYNWIKNGDYFEIQMSGVDGLGNLKNVEYTALSTAQYDDRVTIMTTIKRVLEHVGFELDFKVQLGTWCTNDSLMGSSECALDKADSDSRRFQKSKEGRLTNTNCYEVLSELLEPLNCYLIQSEGVYWIINTREDDSYYFPIAWSNLAVSARVASDLKVTLGATDRFQTLGTTQRIRPIETVGVTFRDRNIQDNSLTNGDFHLNNTDEWVESADFETFTTSAWGLNYELATAIVIQSPVISAPVDFHSVAQSIVVRGESDQIQVQFQVRCADLIMNSSFAGESFEAFVKVSCQIRKGTFDGDIINPGGGAIMLSNADSEHRLYKYYMDIHEDDDYFIEILIDKLESTVWDDYDTIDIRFDNFDVIAAYSTGEDITFDSYKKISNADSNYTDFLDIDLKFGDSASDTDIGAFKINGTRTETWSRAGKSENESINKLSGLNILENFSQYKNYIRVEAYDPTDKILPHSIIEIDSKLYQQIYQDISYPVALQKLVSMELVEILSDAINVTVVDVGLSTVDGDGGSSTPHTNAVTNPSTNPSQGGLYEPPLGNPLVDGYVLSSTTAGARSWIAVSGITNFWKTDANFTVDAGIVATYDDLEFSGSNGFTVTNAGSGSIFLNNSSAFPLNISSSSGDIVLTQSSTGSGKIRLQQSNGTGDILLRSLNTGDIQLFKSSSTGNIDIDNSTNGSILINNSGSGGSLSIINAGSGGMSITNSNGDITLTDTSATAKGIECAADYSGNYTIRSYTDKGYVDGKISSGSPTSGGTGVVGTLQYDATYLYVCYATNTWGRIALVTGY